MDSSGGDFEDSAEEGRARKAQQDFLALRPLPPWPVIDPMTVEDVNRIMQEVYEKERQI